MARRSNPNSEAVSGVGESWSDWATTTTYAASSTPTNASSGGINTQFYSTPNTWTGTITSYVTMEQFAALEAQVKELLKLLKPQQYDPEEYEGKLAILLDVCKNLDLLPEAALEELVKRGKK